MRQPGKRKQGTTASLWATPSLLDRLPTPRLGSGTELQSLAPPGQYSRESPGRGSGDHDHYKSREEHPGPVLSSTPALNNGSMPDMDVEVQGSFQKPVGTGNQPMSKVAVEERMRNGWSNRIGFRPRGVGAGFSPPDPRVPAQYASSSCFGVRTEGVAPLVLCLCLPMHCPAKP